MVSWREQEKHLREQTIISAAEKLFCERGLEKTSMDDIAAEAQFTKRTVYQYFSGKQDLYYAVVLRGIRGLLQSVKEAGEDLRGFDRLREKRLAAWRCARDNAGTFMVMSQIRLIRSSGESNEYERQIVELSAQLYAVFREALEESYKDGSLPPANGALEQGAAFFIIIGTLARLADVGGAYAAQFGADTEEFALKVLGLTDRLLMPWS